MNNAEAICEAVYPNRFSFSGERELQDGIAKVLTERGVEFEREVVMSPWDRLDFLTSDGVAIEVKVDMSLAGVTRQLWRYAHNPKVSQLILVTTRSKHRAIERTLNGKPVLVVYLLNSAL